MTSGAERPGDSYSETIDHHSVIIAGAGPGGLGVAAVLEGWRPRLTGNFQYPVPEVQQLAEAYRNCLLELDQHRVMEAGLRPIEFFRMRHHPQQDALPLDQWTLAFDKRAPAADWLMLSLDGPGGLWNNVPREQLTLGPAQDRKSVV